MERPGENVPGIRCPLLIGPSDSGFGRPACVKNCVSHSGEAATQNM